MLIHTIISQFHEHWLAETMILLTGTPTPDAETFLGSFVNVIYDIKGDVYSVGPSKIRYRVFIKYCVFSLKCCDFSELCQFCCSTGVLPAWRVYTHWHREKTESGKYIKIFEKTQYLMNTL